MMILTTFDTAPDFAIGILTFYQGVRLQQEAQA